MVRALTRKFTRSRRRSARLSFDPRGHDKAAPTHKDDTVKIEIRAGGILKKSPEREMIDHYTSRITPLMRGTGFCGFTETEIDLRRFHNRKEETERLLRDIPADTLLIIMDERGKTLTSRALATQMANWRDQGHKHMLCVFGGADGFEPSALPSHITRWALGPQTWPHKLARVMLCEQIYRGLSILANTPYHRD